MRVFVYIKGKRPASCEARPPLVGVVWRSARGRLVRFTGGDGAVVVVVDRVDGLDVEVVATGARHDDQSIPPPAQLRRARLRVGGVHLEPAFRHFHHRRRSGGAVGEGGWRLDLFRLARTQHSSDAHNANEKNFLHGFILPNSH